MGDLRGDQRGREVSALLRRALADLGDPSADCF